MNGVNQKLNIWKMHIPTAVRVAQSTGQWKQDLLVAAWSTVACKLSLISDYRTKQCKFFVDGWSTVACKLLTSDYRTKQCKSFVDGWSTVACKLLTYDYHTKQWKSFVDDSSTVASKLSLISDYHTKQCKYLRRVTVVYYVPVNY